jgi:N-acetylneuraminic acid mutarotase
VQGVAAIPGQVIMTTQATAPAGFTQTGIRINYESPWETGGSLPSPNYYGASAVADGKLYLMGGYNGSSDVNANLAYDPATKTWTTKAAIPLSGLEGQTLTEANGKLYHLGGIFGSGSMVSASLCYDPAANTWSTIATMPTTALNHAAASHNGKVYVFGGNVSYPSGAAITVTHVYDIASNAWSTQSGLPTWRGIMTATASGGKIHLIGGSISGTYTRVHEVFDPATNTWSTAALLPEARSYHETVASGGRIYVFGGILSGVTPVNSALQFDVASNTWMSVSSMVSARYRPAIGLINGKAILSGGRGTSGILASTEEYTLPKTIYLVERN